MTRTTLPRGRTLARAILGLWAIVLPLYAWKVWTKHDYTDFLVYYREAARMLEGRWDELYSTGDGASPFRYAPVVLWPLLPFALLPAQVARLVWYVAQFGCYLLAFGQLRALLERVGLDRARATLIVGLSSIGVIRFILDSFTIGQITGLLFLALALVIEGWVLDQPRRAGFAGWIAGLLKIGPAVITAPFLARPRFFRTLAAAMALTALLALAGGWATHALGGPGPLELWSRWLAMLADDPNYFDSSHYGNQSLWGALLRLEKAGWIASETAGGIRGVASALVLGLWLALALLRQAVTPGARLLQITWGIFPFVWLMPETFKYSLPVLAFPLLALGASSLSRRARCLLIAIGAFWALGGKDLLPDALFFGLQRHSVIFLSTVILGAWAFVAAWRAGRWTCRLRRPAPAPDAFRDLAPGEAAAGEGLLLWIRIPSRVDADDAPTPTRASEVLGPGVRDADWKIVALEADEDRADAVARELRHARPRWIAQAWAPRLADASFFADALARLQAEPALAWVRASRLDPRTRFRVRVRGLTHAFQRTRWGLRYSAIAARLLGLSGRDPFARNWVARADDVARDWSRSELHDGLLQLEWARALRGRPGAVLELATAFRVSWEPEWEDVLADASQALAGTVLCAFRRAPSAPRARVTADDWGISPGVNAAILDLARAGVVHRVSVLVDGPAVERGWKELRAIPNLEFGLHFQLTYRPASTPGRFLLAWARRPDPERARAELRRQAARLRELGVAFDSLEGHHHVHLAPGLLDVLREDLRSFGIRRVRLTTDPGLLRGSRAPLWLLGVRGAAAARRLGLAAITPSGAFVYPDASDFRSARRLARRLGSRPGAEAIVHPSVCADLAAQAIPDPYDAGRVAEFRALWGLAGWRRA